MIPLSSAAEQQLEELSRYYADLGRDAALDNLAISLERASARYLASRGLFYDAPRPYPKLLRSGWRWTKEGQYWIAFLKVADSVVIMAIFHERANIPDRL